METIYINAKAKNKIKIDEYFSTNGKIFGLVTTIQYLNQLPEIQSSIKNSIIGGQILGCNIKPAEKINESVDAFLYIGTGRFHPLTIKKELKKEVYCLNPISGIIDTIRDEEIERTNQKEKAGITAFLAAEKVGIIVTTKSGQNRIKDAIKLKEKLDKKCYIFIAETINLGDFENYRLDCLVNTACPRLVEDESPRPMVNIDTIYPLVLSNKS